MIDSFDVVFSDGNRKTHCARLDFEEYSFQADDGRVIDGYTCSLVFSWGRIKLTPKGCDCGSLLGLLNLSAAVSDADEEK
mgnify:FL=1